MLRLTLQNDPSGSWREPVKQKVRIPWCKHPAACINGNSLLALIGVVSNMMGCLTDFGGVEVLLRLSSPLACLSASFPLY